MVYRARKNFCGAAQVGVDAVRYFFCGVAVTYTCYLLVNKIATNDGIATFDIALSLYLDKPECDLSPKPRAPLARSSDHSGLQSAMPSRDLLVPDALLPISKSGDIDMQQLGELRRFAYRL